MNVVLATYLRFSGQTTELEGLLNDIAEVVVKHGYGCVDDTIVSLITLKESDIASFDHPGDYAKFVVNKAIAVVIPTQEEADESSSGD
jgi:hypothetical protein